MGVSVVPFEMVETRACSSLVLSMWVHDIEVKVLIGVILVTTGSRLSTRLRDCN